MRKFVNIYMTINEDYMNIKLIKKSKSFKEIIMNFNLIVNKYLLDDKYDDL